MCFVTACSLFISFLSVQLALETTCGVTKRQKAKIIKKCGRKTVHTDRQEDDQAIYEALEQHSLYTILENSAHRPCQSAFSKRRTRVFSQEKLTGNVLCNGMQFIHQRG